MYSTRQPEDPFIDMRINWSVSPGLLSETRVQIPQGDIYRGYQVSCKDLLPGHSG
jgi:hypothetical protein